MKFEHILNKKVNTIETLGKILIQQERDFLEQYKQQSKIFKKIGISKEGESNKANYELQSLLNESSSDDEKNQDDEDSNDDEETGDTEFDSALLIDLDGDTANPGQLLIPEEEKEVSAEMRQFADKMTSRTNQIGNVTQSIGKIQNMFKTLNEIVQQQGQTLDRLEDNITDAKCNTGDTVNELKETLKTEAPNLTQRINGPRNNDLSTTCVLIWFVFALVMFLIDFHSEE